MYGGAAGGGKSEALLMWLAEGIHIATYSAIIFRRTYKQLNKSNDSLVSKSLRVYPALGGKFNSTHMQWRFPSGALIEMGALEHELSVLDYQGNSYHRMAFDEVTQFTESQYEYLVNSRMRKSPDFPITLGVRSGSNPGGPGHVWVKNRFVSDEAMLAIRELNAREPSPRGMIFEAPKGRMFVPARIADNPFLDLDDYVSSLTEFTDPVMRERLMNGDWSILPNAMIKAEWLRYYDMQGDIIRLYQRDGSLLGAFDVREARQFGTIDTAGTSEQKAKEAKGKPPSWSVAAVWNRPPAKFGNLLVLRDIWRKRVEFPDLLAGIREMHAKWRLPKWKIENAHAGPQVWSMLRGTMPIELVSHEGKGKVERNAPFLNMLSRGEVYLPRYNNDWRPPLEAEWLVWTGLDEETADQIDVGGYAAREVMQVGGTWGGVIAN